MLASTFNSVYIDRKLSNLPRRRNAHINAGESSTARRFQDTEGKGEIRMLASRRGQTTGLDLKEKCCGFVLEEIAAPAANLATDDQIRQWSYKAYSLTRQRHLAAGLDEQASRRAGLCVALQIVAYSVYQQIESRFPT